MASGADSAIPGRPAGNPVSRLALETGMSGAGVVLADGIASRREGSADGG
jgi:hypothetical protein